MEDEFVSKHQFARVGNDFIGVINHRIERDTPRLVTDDTLAVLACLLAL